MGLNIGVFQKYFSNVGHLTQLDRANTWSVLFSGNYFGQFNGSITESYIMSFKFRKVNTKYSKNAYKPLRS